MNPILLEFPHEFETPRLWIRAPRPGDGAVVNEAVRESFAELTQWMPWAQHEPSVEESEEYCRRAQARFLTREELQLQLFLRDGTFAGSSGLHRIDWDVPRFEIGYWLRTSLHGQGLMTEAVIGIAAFAFDYLGAQRVEIRCDARNEKSAAVARRAGFELEACLRREVRDHHGALRDTLVYARLGNERLGNERLPLGDGRLPGSTAEESI